MSWTLVVVVVLVFVAGYGVVALWSRVLGPFFAPSSAERTRRLLADGDGMGDPDACWQCEHQGLTRLETAVYQCQACRNVQGPRAAEYIARKRRAELADLPLEQRLTRMSAALRDVELPLVSVRGDLELILRTWTEHERDRGGDDEGGSHPVRDHERTEMRSLFEACTAEIQRIEARLQDAVVLSGSAIRVTNFDAGLLYDHWHHRWDEGDMPPEFTACKQHIADLAHTHRTLRAALAELSESTFE